VYLGFCEELGVWRIVAPPVDSYGVIGPDGSLDNFEEALQQAIAVLEGVKPELAASLAAILRD
jgi:hypothetical protein